MYQTQWEVEGQLLCMRFVSVIMFIINIVKIYGDFVIFTAVFIVLFVSNFCRQNSIESLLQRHDRQIVFEIHID